SAWDKTSSAIPTITATTALTVRPVAHGVGSPDGAGTSLTLNGATLHAAGAGEGDRRGCGDVERVHPGGHRDAHSQIRCGQGFGGQSRTLGTHQPRYPA